jgi:general secretion pathway protein B
MSFILDALKKSETDRQRQNGPALFEVKVAPPRNGLPLWAVGLGALLAVNLVIVAWVLLRRPAQAETNAAQGAQSFQASGGRDGQAGPPLNGPGAGQGSQPGGGGAWQGGQPGQGGQTWQGGQAGQGQPGQGQAWQGAQQGQPGQGQAWQGGQQGQPGQGQAWQGAQQGQPGQGGQGWQQAQNPYPGQSGAMGPGGGPQGQAVAGTAPTGPLAQAAGPTTGGQGFNGAAGAPDTGGEKLSADDYAPAAEAPAPAPFGNHVAQGTANGVPLYQQAALQPGTHIPELRLDLHVFDSQPQKRFVMINMHKLHEGDTLPEGVRVESIVPEGAVLSKDGTRFLLPRQ